MAERCNRPATWQTDNGMRLCREHQRRPEYADVTVRACKRPKHCDHPLDGMGAASSWKRGMAKLPLLLLLAMAGCHKPDDGPKTPDVSDPFRPPPQTPSPYRLRGVQVYESGDVLLVVEVGQ